MRTIKFRGRHLCGQWYYGNLIVREMDSPVPETAQAYKCVMIGDVEDGSEEEVEEETIGQFTGLLDKNGMEIYEGDVVHLGDPRITYVLLWLDCGFKAKQIGAYGSFCGVTYWAETITIVGNIHDNPELLKNND